MSHHATNRNVSSVVPVLKVRSIVSAALMLGTLAVCGSEANAQYRSRPYTGGHINRGYSSPQRTIYRQPRVQQPQYLNRSALYSRTTGYQNSLRRPSTKPFYRPPQIKQSDSRAHVGEILSGVAGIIGAVTQAGGQQNLGNGGSSCGNCNSGNCYYPPAYIPQGGYANVQGDYANQGDGIPMSGDQESGEEPIQ